MLASCLLGGIVINVNDFLRYVFDEKLHLEREMLKDFESMYNVSLSKTLEVIMKACSLVLQH